MAAAVGRPPLPMKAQQPPQPSAPLAAVPEVSGEKRFMTRSRSEPPPAAGLGSSRGERALVTQAFGVPAGIDNFERGGLKEASGPVNASMTRADIGRVAAANGNIDSVIWRRSFHGQPGPGSSLSPRLQAHSLQGLDIDAPFGVRCYEEDKTADNGSVLPMFKESFDEPIGSNNKATRRHFFDSTARMEKYIALIGRPRNRSQLEVSRQVYPEGLPPLPPGEAYEQIRKWELERGWQLVGSWKKTSFPREGDDFARMRAPSLSPRLLDRSSLTLAQIEAEAEEREREGLPFGKALSLSDCDGSTQAPVESTLATPTSVFTATWDSTMLNNAKEEASEASCANSAVGAEVSEEADVVMQSQQFSSEIKRLVDKMLPRKAAEAFHAKNPDLLQRLAELHAQQEDACQPTVPRLPSSKEPPMPPRMLSKASSSARLSSKNLQVRAKPLSARPGSKPAWQ
eukprot:TRINITY_DN19927_c0_g1_i1.p1 TRINITY_DN19927_c0_g1~~TRINITY_DN19927_c0_g1_i1.p1  ORF type:complete len:456 (+),score=124.93 TRINITY_DN19927_c0_g1_i1:174-1541(+)